MGSIILLQQILANVPKVPQFLEYRTSQHGTLSESVAWSGGIGEDLSLC